MNAPRTATGAVPASAVAPPTVPRTGLVPGRSDVRYGFSTRAHGTASDTVGDGDAMAARRALLAEMGQPDAPVALMRQVHGRAVATVEGVDGGPPPEADGLLTTRPDTPLGVFVADCVPVLLSAGDAIGAVHAGRGGVALDIVGEAVDALLASSGVPAESATAVIGPAIGPCCYEVPTEMAEEVVSTTGLPGARARTSWGTDSLDLPGAVALQLAARGVTRTHRVGGCTRCDAEVWFSHRASTADADAFPPGRQIGVIVREEP
ncbi:polyphenol oxidase family protein [Euzebya rosea]|uniref:polyphenol oxidase family protein n=1 Tax=Euzebya rosea TaxID=2052804 RepID=UPI000D3E565E|nr:polyphenol oxidase family protein [Euzebya rosea]